MYKLKHVRSIKEISTEAKTAATKHWALVEDTFQSRYEDLAGIAGHKVATTLANKSSKLVLSREATPRIQKLLAPPFRLTSAQLVTLMCGGVAAGMGREAGWARLHELLAPPFRLTSDTGLDGRYAPTVPAAYLFRCVSVCCC